MAMAVGFSLGNTIKEFGRGGPSVDVNNRHQKRRTRNIFKNYLRLEDLFYSSKFSNYKPFGFYSLIFLIF